MNLERKSFALFFAILVAFLKVTGVSATEAAWSSLNDTREEIKLSEPHSLWASEEIFQILKLPEYSEHQFSGSTVIPGNHYEVFRLETRLLPTSLPHRDLRNLISSLLFPFHFFL